MTKSVSCIAFAVIIVGCGPNRDLPQGNPESRDILDTTSLSTPTPAIASIASAAIADQPKVIDAYLTHNRLLITLFYRRDPADKSTIFHGNCRVVIDGTDHVLNNSDTFVTESQTSLRNYLVEMWIDIPPSLQGKPVQSATVEYKISEDGPDIIVTKIRSIAV